MSHKGKRKKPVEGARVEAKKVPRRAVAGRPTGDNPTVIWGLSYVDLDGPWGWDKIANDALRRVLDVMRELEALHPGEAFGSRHKRIGLDALSRDAQRRLAEIELDDLDSLWELRVSGRERIWGHRVGHVFYPIWWDPRHEVCPSKKKHT